MTALFKCRILTVAFGMSIALVMSSSATATSGTPPEIREASLVLKGLLLYIEALGQPLLASSGGPHARSWRVEMLPMFEQEALRKSYDDTQAWNSATNRKLLDSIPAPYAQSRLPAEAYRRLGLPGPPPTTRFVAVVDNDAAWKPGQALKLGQISDGLENTIVIVEAPDLEIPWMEPRDPSLSEATELLGTPLRRYADHFFSITEYQSDFRYVGFADGHFEPMPLLSPQTAKAFLTSEGNDVHLTQGSSSDLTYSQASLSRTTHVKRDRVVIALGIVAIAVSLIVRIIRRRSARAA